MDGLKELCKWLKRGIIAVGAALAWIAFAVFRSKQQATAKAEAKTQKKADDARIDALETNEEHRKELLR